MTTRARDSERSRGFGLALLTLLALPSQHVQAQWTNTIDTSMDVSIMVSLATLPVVGYVTAVGQQDSATMESYRAVAASTVESVLGMHPDELLFTEVGPEVRP